MGWLLLLLAAQGALIPALILPLYFIADATLTLAYRLVCRQKLWEAHRSHFYQRAVIRLGEHRPVVRRVNITNFLLVILAAVAAKYPDLSGLSLILALCIVIILLWISATGSSLKTPAFTRQDGGPKPPKQE